MPNRPVLLVGVPAAVEVKVRAALPGADLHALTALSHEVLRRLEPVAAVVWLDGRSDAGFAAVHALETAGARVIVIGPQKDADLILRAMREGAKEFVTQDDDEALVRALRSQVRTPQVSGAGHIYAVFPAKGGVGATTIATNLAGVLQSRGDRVCLIDLNLNMGDVLAFLDLAGGYSLSDVINNMQRLDRDLLDATLLRHNSGVRILAQSHRVEESDRVDAASLSALLEFLRHHFGAIVLDGLRSFDDLSVAAIDGSDRILLVLTQEVPAVRDARRCVDLFTRLGCEPKLNVIVNRYQKSHEIDLDVIAETVGTRVAATIANDYPAVIRAVNKGVMLAEDGRSAVARDVDALVHVLGHASSETAPATTEKKSLLKRFFPMRTSHAAD